jgi:hypothetical protein
VPVIVAAVVTTVSVAYWQFGCNNHRPPDETRPELEVSATASMHAGELTVSIWGQVSPVNNCRSGNVEDLKIIGSPGPAAINLPYRVPRFMRADSAMILKGPLVTPLATVEVSGTYVCVPDYGVDARRTRFRKAIPLRDADDAGP